MSDAEIARTGGCRCGAVRYRARGRPKWQAHCHCKECRGQTGAAFASWLGYETGAVTWEKGRAKEFVPSPGVVRAFCGDCGTPLYFSATRWPGEIHVLAGTLDDPATVAPAAHTYLIDAVPWANVPQTAKRFWRTPKEGGPLP